MSGLNVVAQEYPEDNGSADPAVAAALAAYAAGQASETAALTALSTSRLLVPVVAIRAGPPAASHPPDPREQSEPPPPPEGATLPGLRSEKRGTSAGATREENVLSAPAGTAPGASQSDTANMAVPTVIGADGRAALPAFTCLDALTRWRADARPVPLPAAQVWLAATQEASAAVIDLAGPVPIAVEGARLAALAAGEPPPPPHADPDVVAVTRDVLAREQPLLAGVDLLPGGENSDLVLAVRLAPGRHAGDPAVREAIERAAAGLLAGTGGRFRRGIEVALTQPDRGP